MKKGSWLAGIGLLGACALCCALPLIGGAAALGISSFFLNPVIVAVLALVLVIVWSLIYHRRKANGSTCIKTGCNCNSCSK
jgi:CHASE2 domain-containing sensor protein